DRDRCEADSRVAVGVPPHARRGDGPPPIRRPAPELFPRGPEAADRPDAETDGRAGRNRAPWRALARGETGARRPPGDAPLGAVRPLRPPGAEHPAAVLPLSPEHRGLRDAELRAPRPAPA